MYAKGMIFNLYSLTYSNTQSDSNVLRILDIKTTVNLHSPIAILVIFKFLKCMYGKNVFCI